MALQEKLIDSLGSFATKFNSYRYIMAIKSSFITLMPVIIVGAFSVLISNMVLDPKNGLASFSALSFLAQLKPITAAINYATLNFLNIGAVFLIGIGGKLADGKRHDVRAPDYDDWSTASQGDFKGLNGDIMVWNPLLEDAFELSSMGIRVDAEALKRQLAVTGDDDRLQLEWHQSLLKGEMPQTIGGGIGQSRLAMLLLQKEHIGQVQVGVWPSEMKAAVQGML